MNYIYLFNPIHPALALSVDEYNYKLMTKHCNYEIITGLTLLVEVNDRKW